MHKTLVHVTAIGYSNDTHNTTEIEMSKTLAEKMYYLNTSSEYSYTVFALSVIYNVPQSIVRTLIEQGRELSSKQVTHV